MREAVATESESVPEHDDPPEGSSDQPIPMPEGFVLDGGLLRPDETALAPIIAARQAKWWAELERIPNFAAVLDEFLAQPEVQLYARSIVEAAAPEATGIDVLVHQGLQHRFEAALLAAAYRLDADHVPAIHRRLFLLGKALDALAPQLGDAALSPAQLASLVGLLEPVDLRANPPGSGLIHALPLRPGEIAMRFTTAAVKDRRPYNTLVARAQKAFGYLKAKDSGGRHRRDEDEELAALAIVAARLHHWPSPSWEHQQIAELFGWKGSADAVRERVRRAIRQGEEALDKDKELGGPGWRVKVPPKIAERQ